MSSIRPWAQFSPFGVCALFGGFVANCSGAGPSVATATDPQEMILQVGEGSPSLSARVCGVKEVSHLSETSKEQRFFYDDLGRLDRVVKYNDALGPDEIVSEDRYVYDEASRLQKVNRFNYLQLPGDSPAVVVTFDSCE